MPSALLMISNVDVCVSDELASIVISIEETLADMTERDRRDMTRRDSPLKIADDAIVIDSTGKSIEQVFEEMMSKIKVDPAFENCKGGKHEVE